MTTTERPKTSRAVSNPTPDQFTSYVVQSPLRPSPSLNKKQSQETHEKTSISFMNESDDVMDIKYDNDDAYVIEHKKRDIRYTCLFFKSSITYHCSYKKFISFLGCFLFGSALSV